MIPRFDCVFFVGTGAIEGAWPPVMAAIEEAAPGIKLNGNEKVANAWFAHRVYELRQWAALAHVSAAELTARQGEPLKPGEHRDYLERARVGLDKARQRDGELKSLIAKHVHAALQRKSIYVRPSFLSAFQRHAGGTPDSVAVLTTNWDLTLEQQLPKEMEILHLHGTTIDTSTLYLPTEMGDEPYRTPDERVSFFQNSYKWQHIAGAKRVIIYGLSMSPLDPELSLMFQTGILSKVKPDITIMDLAAQLPDISARVRLLVGKTPTVLTEAVGS
jgi:hypothetical protein